MATETDGYYPRLVRRSRGAEFKRPVTVLVDGEKDSGMTYYAVWEGEDIRLLYQPKRGRDGNLLVEVAKKPKAG